MPAPRAVLADLLANNMNPGQAWTVTDKGGHLTPTPKVGAKHAGQHINQRSLPVATQPVQNALKELPKKEEPKPVVAPKVEERVVDEEVTVIASSKKKAPGPIVAAEAVKPVEKPTDEKPVS